MKWLTLVLLITIPTVALGQNPKDPSTYPDTIVVNSSHVQTDVVATNINTTHRPAPLPPSGVLSGIVNGINAKKPETTTTTTEVKKSYYIVVGNIGDIQYTLQGGPGVPLGTFKAKITNGMYADIMVTRADGTRYNVGFKIIGQDRLQSVPQTETKQ